MVARIQELPLDELYFDPDNPRLPKRIVGADDSQVLDWMLQDAGLVELMNSIAENGYFPAEPLLVCPASGRRGYVVLEGNRRLAAVKLLVSPQTAPRRKRAVLDAASSVAYANAVSTLPCVVFEKKDEVLDYLGFRHVTGVKQWEPAAKARYLAALYSEHKDSSRGDVYRVIARIIGSRADYVARLLTSLNLYNAILDDRASQRLGLTEETVSFSLLTLALNYTDIVEYLKLPSLQQYESMSFDKERLMRLARFMYAKSIEEGRTQLGESRNMRLLATALSHPKGRKSLTAGDIVEEAVGETLDLNQVVAVSLKQAGDRLERVRSSLPHVRVTGTLLANIEDVQNLLDIVLKTAKKKQRQDADV
jgi:hypothetical protein